MIIDFRGYREISDFDPQTKYFHENVKIDFSKKAIFRGVTAKIEFGENWLYRYRLYYGSGVKRLFLDFS